MLQYTLAANETECVSFLGSKAPLCCAWASFYMLKGSPTGGNAEKGKSGKGVAVGIATCIVYPT